jgi:tetratricopeptide (TPR) repeat protein
MSRWRRKREPERIEITVKLPPEDILQLKINATARRLGETHPETLKLARELAEVLSRTPGKRGEAVELCVNITRILWDTTGLDTPFAMDVIHLGGDAAAAGGDLVQAEKMLQDVLERRERVLGRDHPDTRRTIEALARVLIHLQRPEEAEALLQDMHDRGGGDPLDIANALRAGDRLAEAEAMYRELLVGADPRRAEIVRNNLGAVLFQQGRVDEAVQTFRQLLTTTDAELEASTRNNLATALFELERYAEAVAELRLSAAIQERLRGGDDLVTVNARENLAMALERTGDRAEAARLARDCLAYYEKRLPPGHPRIRHTRELLARL